MIFNWRLKKKHCYPFKNVLLFPLPTQSNVETQEKLQVIIFNIVCGVEGEARQVKLYSRTTVCRACVKKKNDKYKFVPKLLSMTVISWVEQNATCTKYTRHPELLPWHSSESKSFILKDWKYYLHKQIHCFPAMFPSCFKVWWVQKIISGDSVISYSFVSTHHPDNNIRHAVLRLLTKFKDF